MAKILNSRRRRGSLKNSTQAENWNLFLFWLGGMFAEFERLWETFDFIVEKKNGSLKIRSIFYTSLIPLNVTLFLPHSQPVPPGCPHRSLVMLVAILPYISIEEKTNEKIDANIHPLPFFRVHKCSIDSLVNNERIRIMTSSMRFSLIN